MILFTSSLSYFPLCFNTFFPPCAFRLLNHQNWILNVSHMNSIRTHIQKYRRTYVIVSLFNHFTIALFHPYSRRMVNTVTYRMKQPGLGRCFFFSFRWGFMFFVQHVFSPERWSYCWEIAFSLHVHMPKREDKIVWAVVFVTLHNRNMKLKSYSWHSSTCWIWSSLLPYVSKPVKSLLYYLHNGTFLFNYIRKHFGWAW